MTDNGVAVTAGSFVSVSVINSGLLVFTPVANQYGTSYDSFTFQVQDNGGTGSGGHDTDPSPKTMTINVTAVVTLLYVDINSDAADTAIYDDGVQRSMVDSVVLYFDTAVNLDESAVTITLFSDVTVTLGNGTQTTGMVGTIPDDTTWASPDGGYTWVVTFGGDGVTNGGSIANGVYDFTLNTAHITTLDGSAVTLNAYNGGNGGTGNDSEIFWRLFGDANGNQKVTTQDYAAFAQSYLQNSNQAGYVAWFDQNGNDRVTTQDYAAFANDYLMRYSGFTATI